MPSIRAGLPVYESADALFEAVEKGELKLDAVIIATPHYAHEELAVRAFQNGLHVLCDKPSGVYSRQARISRRLPPRASASLAHQIQCCPTDRNALTWPFPRQTRERAWAISSILINSGSGDIGSK